MDPFTLFAGDAAFGDLGTAGPSTATQSGSFGFNSGPFGGNNAGAAFPAWFPWAVLILVIVGLVLWLALS